MPAVLGAHIGACAWFSASNSEVRFVSTIGIRQTILLVILFIVVSVSMIALDNSSALDPLRTGLRNAVDPAVSWIDRVTNRDDNGTPLEVQLAQVTKERDELAAENAQLKSQMDLVAPLLAVQGVQEANPEWKLVVATVVNPDPSGLQKLVTIDKGSADGIEVGMAVVDPNYLVGVITTVDEHSARVTLAIDATFQVGAKLLDTKGIGIAYGQWQYGGRIEMRHVSRDVTPEQDEVVVTSDESDARTSKVPPAIIIGNVTGDPEVDNASDSQTIQILPAADFDNLSIVAVIISDGEDQNGS
jgi:rod shape-determining protein MreC